MMLIADVLCRWRVVAEGLQSCRRAGKVLHRGKGGAGRTWSVVVMAVVLHDMTTAGAASLSSVASSARHSEVRGAAI